MSVGTPDYISPETLQAVEKKNTYGRAADWWSFGVVIYEMLFGDTPFYSESLAGTYTAIMNHKNLSFPEDVVITDEAKDLIRRLLTDKKHRLGANSVDEIKSHPWFASVDWKRLKETCTPTPPLIPHIYHILTFIFSSYFSGSSLRARDL